MPDIPNTLAVLAVIDRIEIFINQSEIIPATQFYRTKILLALLSKALTTSRAICALLSAGFQDEAYGLLRTLVEIFFSVRFISNDDTESRATRYTEYFGKVHQHTGELFEKFFPKHVLPPPGHHKESMAWAENYRSAHQWLETRGAIGAMAYEEDAFDVDDVGRPLKQAFDYELVYWDASHFVHGTVMSLTPHLSPQGEPFRVRGGPTTDSRQLTYTLFNVIVFLRKTLISTCRGIREDSPPEEILNDMLELMTAYAQR